MDIGKKLLLLTTIMLGYSHLTFANTGTKSFIFEPYVGTEYGTWSETQTITASSTTTTYSLGGNALGYFYGAKLFYIWRGMFLIGVDYQMGAITQKYAQDEGTTIDDSFEDVSGSKSSGGIVFGLFKNLWSFKFSYFPINNMAMEKGVVTGSSELSYSGSAIAANFSYTIRPKINLNLEYVSNSYDTIESNGQSGTLPGTFSGVTYSELTRTSYRIYVSFPF